MSDPRARRLRELFEATCDLDGDARRSYLDDACGDDESLRRDAERLLARDRHGSSALDRPVLPPGSRDALLSPATTSLPEIPGLRVTRRVGAGSMGAVYEAEQDHPRRRVAVKVLRLGLATEDARRRFEDEGDILARLDHPSIARVFAAGAADLDHGPCPYFVMEFVEGRSPDEFAERAGLDVRGRLELIARIADGVAHAHARGVIHRDLKPGNILVTSDGRPKIFDFGVARFLSEGRDGDAPPRTLEGQLLGTLFSMSPEQARGDSRDVDTRSDVYALGVIAYLLLGGKAPIETDDVELPEALRRVQEVDPAPLSRLDARLAGDVEVMVGKALRKEPAERYASAAELASDVRRHLRDEPITARAPGALESIARFARRHRTLAAAVALAAVMLVVALVGVGWGLVRSRAALAESAAVTGFLESVFTSVDPEVLGPDIRASDVLRAAEGRVDQEFADRPALAARLRRALGNAWWGLGRYEEAEASFRRAWEHDRRVLGVDAARTLEVQTWLGLALARLGRLDEALPRLEEALRRATAVLGAGHPTTLVAGARLADALRLASRFEEAVERARATLSDARERLGDEHAQTAACRFLLASCLFETSKKEEAEAEVREAIRVHRDALGSDPVKILPLRALLSSVLLRRGEYDAALRLVEEEVSTRREVYGDDHPSTLWAMHRLAYQLADRSRATAALEWSTRSLEGHRRVLGDADRSTIQVIVERTRLLTQLGRYDEATALADEAVETSARVFGEAHETTFNARVVRATLHRLMDDVSVAVDALDSLLATARELYGDESAAVASTIAKLAAAKFEAGDDEAALALFEEAVVIGALVYGEDHPNQVEIRVGLAMMHLSAGRLGLARPLLEEAVVATREALGDDHEKTIVAEYYLAMTDLNGGRVPEARRRLDELVPRADRVLGPDHRVTAALRELVEMLDRKLESADG